MENYDPLVSIGIPTYNRQGLLARAIASAQAQTHRNLEIVVSDNASTDGTESLCRNLMQADRRIRYQRAQVNRGATWNFQEVLRHVSGEYFMWLGDDDWIDSGYVAACLSQLLSSADLALVGGRVEYIRDTAVVEGGRMVGVGRGSPWWRVLSYYMQVTDNGIFYGLMRTEVVRAVTLPNELAGDWLLVAAMAFHGRIETLEDTVVHRELGGATVSFSNICRSLGLPRHHAVLPEIVIALNIARDVLYRGPAYRDCPVLERAVWAAILLVSVMVRLVWRTSHRRVVRELESLRTRWQ